MKIATWNVNSLKVRLPHLSDWLATHSVDVVCLQETKLTDDKFPVQELGELGYDAVFAGQKTYNGVAIVTRRSSTAPAQDVQVNIPGFEDEQKRVLTATVAGIRIVCAYFPNGQAVGSEKFAYKLRWIAALTDYLRQELASSSSLLLAGDYNVAPEERDVHDPAAWQGQVLFSDEERSAFRVLVELGLVDAFRLFEQPERSYSWWDYRMLAFRRKMGLRIDHVLLSAPLVARCTACTIDIEPRRLEKPSDHAPVIVTLD